MYSRDSKGIKFPVRRVFFIALVLCSLVLYTGFAEAGTVSTPQQLKSALSGNSSITLACDIDLASTDWTPAGTEERPYTGSIDGRGYAIKNLTVTFTDWTKAAGLIAYAKGGKFKNLRLENCTIGGDFCSEIAGGLIGVGENVDLENCSVDGKIFAGNAGGLIGLFNGVREGGSFQTYNVTNCFSFAEINPFSYNEFSVKSEPIIKPRSIHIPQASGGLIGYIRTNTHVNVRKSAAMGNVFNGSGFIGTIEMPTDQLAARVTIEESYATGDINANGNSAGGFIGLISSRGPEVRIKKCFASGAVTAYTAGGFIGAVNVFDSDNLVNHVVIDHCYSTGRVRAGSYGGGFAGQIRGSDADIVIQYSYAAGNVSPVSDSTKTGGFIGSVNDSRTRIMFRDGVRYRVSTGYDAEAVGVPHTEVGDYYSHDPDYSLRREYSQVGRESTSHLISVPSGSGEDLMNVPAGPYFSFTGWIRKAGYYPQLPVFFNSENELVKECSAFSVVPVKTAPVYGGAAPAVSFPYHSNNMDISPELLRYSAPAADSQLTWSAEWEGEPCAEITTGNGKLLLKRLQSKEGVGLITASLAYPVGGVPLSRSFRFNFVRSMAEAVSDPVIYPSSYPEVDTDLPLRLTSGAECEQYFWQETYTPSVSSATWRFEDKQRGSYWNGLTVQFDGGPSQIVITGTPVLPTSADCVFKNEEGDIVGWINVVVEEGNSNVLEGTEGEDELLGTSQRDIIIGGRGSDYLEGMEGNDVYVYNRGDGDDVVSNATGNAGQKDEIHFGPGIYREHLEFRMDAGDMLISILANQEAQGSILVEDWSAASHHKLHKIQFDDGSALSLSEMERIAGASGTLTGSDAADTLITGSLNGQTVTVYGLGGNDMITGGAGYDIYIGGPGDDTIQAVSTSGSGDDVFIWNLGDGHDTVTYFNPARSEGDGLGKLKFGPGIAPEDIVAYVEGNNVVFSMNDESGSITFVNGDLGDGNIIDELCFDNGHVLKVFDFPMFVEDASEGVNVDD